MYIHFLFEIKNYQKFENVCSSAFFEYLFYGEPIYIFEFFDFMCSTIQIQTKPDTFILSCLNLFGNLLSSNIGNQVLHA